MLKGVFLRLLKICPVLWPAPSESLLRPQTTSATSSYTWGCLFCRSSLQTMLAVIPGTGLSALHAFNGTFFFSLLCEAFLRSPRLSLCPFASVTLSTFKSAWFAGAWEAALIAGSGTGRARASSCDFPGARLPLLEPPRCF